MLINNRQVSFNKRKHIFLAVIVVLMMIIPLGLYWASQHYSELFNVPQIENGVLDLKDYPLNGNQIPLQGEWEYFSDKWLVTDNEEMSDSDTYIRLPISWENQSPEEIKLLQSSNYGSYRIKLINANQELKLSAFVRSLAGSWRLFINNQLVASSGKLSKDPQEVQSSRIVEMRQFDFSQRSNEELVLEFSKESHESIVRTAPILASNESIIKYEKNQILMAGIFLGVYLMILSFLFLAITVSHIKKGMIAFVIIMLFIFLKISTKIDFGIFVVSGEIINNQWLRFIMEISMIFVPPLYIKVIEPLLSVEPNKKLFKGLMIFDIFIVVSSGILFFFGLMNAIFFCWLLSFLTYFIVLGYIGSIYFKYEKDTGLILLAYFFLLLGYIVDAFFSNGFLVLRIAFFFPIMVVLFQIFNVLVYMRRGEKVQEEALRLAKVEAVNKDIGSKLMLAQIQPHFLYNALTAILMMIRKDPAKAETALLKFAVFLRRNMTSLGNNNPISFDEAFEHVLNYVAIENLRMGERLKMVYEINVKNFRVPTLTVQPIVENAIKYGPGKKVEGGTVSLKTYEEKEAYVIEVNDDGNGFDVSILEGESEQSLGIRNVRMRLETLVNGKLEINSVLGKGTRVKIIIPKEEKENELKSNNR